MIFLSDSVDIYFGAIRVNNNKEVGRQQQSSCSENILILPNNATALIRLPSKLTFDEYIQPVLFAEENKDYNGATILASAWIDSKFTYIFYMQIILIKF